MNKQVEVFSEDWFRVHQRKLLFLANNPFTRDWFRYVLKVHGNRSSVGDRDIVCIRPNAITWLEDVDRHGKVHISTEFRTNVKFARRLYWEFNPLWRFCHELDMKLLNKYCRELNLGFDSLTVYPSSGTAEDASLRNSHNATSTGTSWANVHDTVLSYGAADQTGPLPAIQFRSTTSTANNWYNLCRGIFLFDTRSLNNFCSISAATLSLYGNSKADPGSISPTINIYQFTTTNGTYSAPSINDFLYFGTTAFSSTISYSSFSTTAYNDFALNSDGIANIAKASISQFGSRDVNYDVANSAPTWWDADIGISANLKVELSSYTGTSRDPKLVVTYTPYGANQGCFMGV